MLVRRSLLQATTKAATTLAVQPTLTIRKIPILQTTTARYVREKSAGFSYERCLFEQAT